MLPLQRCLGESVGERVVWIWVILEWGEFVPERVDATVVLAELVVQELRDVAVRIDLLDWPAFVAEIVTVTPP